MNSSERILWKLYAEKKDIEETLCQKLKIEPIIARVLINRGIETIEEADGFINVSLDSLKDPREMTGMKAALERIFKAISGKEKVMIYGDYDVDGISATSLLVSFFQKIGVNVSFYIPHRIKEGYGLNMTAINEFLKDGYTLLITVDCGVTSIDEVRHATENGLDVIITDHHQIADTLPAAYAVLNPTREDCAYTYKHLAGVGIAFKLISALRELLIQEKAISTAHIPSMKKYMDLVALGTLADMVPLTGENHTLVRFGLNEMATTNRAGLKALINLGNFGLRPIASTDIGFFLAPRLNAIGRLENASLGVELLTTSDRARARDIARKLDEENSKRQFIQNRILEEVLQKIEKEVELDKEKAIILASEGWHPGVIGIVASKVVEKYYLPTILLNIENGIGRGSARSIPNFHIYDSLKACQEKLLHFGGHKYAAGLSLRTDMIGEFKSEFLKIAQERLTSSICKPVLDIDAIVSIDSFNADVVEDIMSLGPFGPANPYPLFLAKGVRFVEGPVYSGREGEHVRFEVAGKETSFDGIAYGMADVFRNIDIRHGRFDIVFTPTISYRGPYSSTVQLKLKDMRPSAGA